MAQRPTHGGVVEGASREEGAGEDACGQLLPLGGWLHLGQRGRAGGRALGSLWPQLMSSVPGGCWVQWAKVKALNG